jgi:PAS domain S-box-containing protein
MKLINTYGELSWRRLWSTYKGFIESRIVGNDICELKDITYWQRTLFCNTILYSLPISLLALVPSIVIALREGYAFIPVVDLITLTSIILVTLNRKLNLLSRKIYVVVVLTFLGIFLMAYLGSFGIGSIYLLELSVFIALLFPFRFAYGTVAVNFLIYAAFGMLIHFKPYHLPITSAYNLDMWTAYSFNFLFLDLIIILQIRYMINGLEKTILEESRLFGILQEEVADKKRRNELLRESEGHYKSLFFQNPSPMWIFDIDSLQFLQVNEAAIRKYGYTNEEFLKLTIHDIRVSKEIEDLSEMFKESLRTNVVFKNVTRHQRKDGCLFDVEVRFGPIPFREKNALLVIAREITDLVEHIRAVEKQNEKLKEIAFMQSHVIRAPLARIIGLSDLITQLSLKDEDKKLLEYLDASVDELDLVIRSIVDHSAEIVPSTIGGSLQDHE